MHRPAQVELLKRLLRYVESKTTALADMPWQNDTSVYVDPGILLVRSRSCSDNTRFSWALLRTGLRPGPFVQTIMLECQSSPCVGAMENFARS